MIMNCFCGIVDRRKMFSLIFSRDHCQRSSPSWIFNTPWTEFESAQNTSSGLVEWNCAVVITTTPRRHKQTIFYDILGKQTIFNGRGKLTTLDTMVLFQNQPVDIKRYLDLSELNSTNLAQCFEQIQETP